MPMNEFITYGYLQFSLFLPKAIKNKTALLFQKQLLLKKQYQYIHHSGGRYLGG